MHVRITGTHGKLGAICIYGVVQKTRSNFAYAICKSSFSFTVLQCNFAIAISFAILQLQLDNCSFAFYTEFPRILGTKAICSLAFLEAFAILTLQFVVAVFIFQKQMQFYVFWKHFYQQFASQKITKTITKRQIPAANPETNNIRLNMRRTLFLQVLLTTCPPYFPTRIVLAPFAS